MNYRYIKSILTAICLTVALGFSSCIGDLDVNPIDPSVTQEFDQDGVFAKIYATMALTGQRGPAENPDIDGIDEGTSSFYRLIFTLNEYPADGLICAWGDTGIPELNFMSWSSSHDQVTGLYARLNFDVTLCNHFLEMTEGADDDKTIKQRAEARFMRAMNFFYLMDFYGNIPFTEVVTSDLPEQIKRADLFLYIENELKEIENDMYDAQQAPYGRADKVAAWLLLARMYLNAEVYTGTAQWANAATYAKKVMDSSYGLADAYRHLFMADNDGSSTINTAKKEIILPIRQHGVNIRSYGGSFYVVAGTRTKGMNSWGSTDDWGGIRARKALIEKFFPNLNVPEGDETVVAAAANDERAMFYNLDRTIEIENVNTFREGLSSTKWTNLREDGNSTNDSKFPDTDVPFLRKAEAYLIYAEAVLRTGGNMNEALTAINALRERAKTSRMTTVSLDDVLDERARELHFEGHRRMDLVRYGYFTSSSYVWDWKGGNSNGTGVNTIYNLYPIPYADLTANEKLVQNPGY